jgi:hypothetical protein
MHVLVQTTLYYITAAKRPRSLSFERMFVLELRPDTTPLVDSTSNHMLILISKHACLSMNNFILKDYDKLSEAS